MTETRTACSYCGVGCGITVTTRPDPVTAAPVIARVAGDRLHPTNFGRLCTKGATHAELMGATEGRLTTALARTDRAQELTPVSVDNAVAEAGRRLRKIIDTHGPDAVALYVSGQMSIEAQYLATKLAKGYLRTIHIESNSRLCMASAGTGFKQSLGADGPPGSYEDFDTADVFLVIGANMADCHPILFLRMADRLKAGAKLIVVDPRRTTTAEKADLFLPIRPGTDLALLNGLLHLLVENGAVDHEFIAEHTDGWDQMPGFLPDYPPERVAAITGLEETDIRRAAELIGSAGNWMSCWTMGLNQSTHGTWNTNAICNLHLATGAICRPGSGPMSLTGQPNAMGGREMGYMGPGLPGQRAVTSPEDRSFVETLWRLEPGTIRSDIGPGTIGMFEQMAAGQIKACWIICTNPVVSVANRSTVTTALQNADLVITQDAYADTATNRYADIVLPAALWAESDAVMVNSERNVTLLQQSIPAPGEARPDWELICDIAAHLGFADAFDYKSAEEIFAEITMFHNPRTGYDLRGISYERLRRNPVQWPAPPDDGDDRHPIRYRNDGISQELFRAADGSTPRLAFATASRRAIFHPRPHLDPAELPDDDYPTVLNTGRLQHQWHTMTKTGRVEKLNKLNPGPFVEIHPADAADAQITDGQQVIVESRRGQAMLPAVITDRVLPGTVWVPFHWNDEHGKDLTVNALTNDAVDPDSLQPEFKVCAVRLTPVTASLDLDLDSAPPALTDDEKLYLAGFFIGIADGVSGVPVLPAGAPVRQPVRLWIDGVLAGRFSRTGSVADQEDEPDSLVDADGPLLLWASQTGTAEEFAARLGQRLGGARVRAMDDTEVAELAGAAEVFIVTSTFGDGGPPDNGARFWSQLAAADAPVLDGTRFAVLGIGDRSYDNFCGHAKALDARLQDLGATRLLDRIDCEAYDDEPMTTWAEQVTALVGTAPPQESIPVAAQAFSRQHPLTVPLCRNTRLTPASAAKEVRHIGFDISEHDVSYAVGDSLGVVVANSDAAVQCWLAATGLVGTQPVHVNGVDMELGQALLTQYDICRVTPDLMRFVAEHCPDKAARVLRTDNSERDRYLINRNGLDIVADFRVRADIEQWQEVLVRLTPRQYSIASSPLVSPHEIALTVSVLRYRGGDGSARGGVASTYLADAPDGTGVPVFVQRSPHFRPPSEGSTPMIMVGPGTGIAPFRGFLQERRALGHQGRNWLFFGDQHRTENFYYREDFEDMVTDGFLNHLDLAFSRDQPRRVYVQHKMADAGAELWRWLDDGAHFYVCGDASRMAVDVDNTLTEIIARHGGMSAEAAHDYKRQMVADKRYVRDVY